MKYLYKHTVTESTTGYFACEPEPALTLEQSFEQLYNAPLDDFLHRHVLRTLMAMSLKQLEDLWAEHNERSYKDILQVLLAECAILHTPLAPLMACLDEASIIENWQDLTPLTYIAWNTLKDRYEHRAWSTFFAANITEHEKLPHPEEMEDEELTPLYTAQELEQTKRDTLSDITKLHAKYVENPGMAWSRPEAQDTAQRALQLLVENAVLDGVEMRHEASLSPIALLRPWAVQMSVESGRNNFTLEGQATTYGRGLSLAQTRASYSMEMIERASTYVSVKENEILDRDGSILLYHARYSELVAEGHSVLDPNALPLEAPYTNAPLYWLEARHAPINVVENTSDTTFIPAQCVFLFSNLDEITLMMNPGSTGLASGNSLAEAKLAALTEILERDAEATIPYDRQRCFILRARDERIAGLLEDYEARGIYVHFMDLTTEFGIPCYQAFVLDKKGKVVRATGANISGSKAALAALTEVPFAYPNGPASGPAIKGLPERYLEDLPDYTLESPSRNVAFLEEVLHGHGYTPLYVDITHKDLEMPVVRAIIPGLELSPELDNFSRIGKRLYKNYLRMFNES